MRNKKQLLFIRLVLGLAGASLSLLMAGACSSNKIVMRVSKTQLGSAYDTESGALKDVRTSYSVQDKQVVAWVEFKNAAGQHTARFKWYNPDQELMLDSGPISVTPDKQLYAWRRVWDVLPIKNAPASLSPGKWRVEVYFDKKRIETLTFVVKNG